MCCEERGGGERGGVVDLYSFTFSSAVKQVYINLEMYILGE